MNKLKNYILSAFDEVINRVSWVKFTELQNNAILVLIASLIFAIFIGLIDLGFKNVLEFFYREF